MAFFRTYPESTPASSYLVNLDKGITALVVMDPFYASAICPDSKVLILDLYPPITLDKAYAAERPAAFALSNFEPSDLKEWEGYGTGY